MINFNDVGPGLIRALFEPRRSGYEARFSKGETIQGWVVKSLNPQTAVIKLRGLDLTASTPKPLAEGQPIFVKVEQLAPQFIVSLLPNDTPAEEKTAALLRMYLPSASPLSSVVEDLANLLPDFSAAALRGSGLEKILDELNTLIKNPVGDSANVLQLIGLSHESELLQGRPTQNLKRALLVVRGNLERLIEKEPKTWADALKKVDAALSNIELRQLMNLSDNREATAWPIPFWNGQGFDTGRLFVERDRKERGKTRKNETVRLTLMVKMSWLGDVRAEAIGFKEKVEGTVYAGSDPAVQAIEAGLPGFLKALRNLGFSASFTAQRASRDFLTRAMETGEVLPVKSLLNLRA